MTERQVKLGKAVIYWGVIKDNGERYNPKLTVIISEPWQLGHALWVCKVEGISGGVSVKHLDTITAESLDMASARGLNITTEDIKNITEKHFQTHGVNAHVPDEEKKQLPEGFVSCNCPCHTKKYKVRHVMPCCKDGIVAVPEAARSNIDNLHIYVIHDHPKDFPELFTIRRQLIQLVPVAMPPFWDMSYFFYSEHLHLCRAEMQKKGLARLAPEPGDDPVIVETWL